MGFVRQRAYLAAIAAVGVATLSTAGCIGGLPVAAGKADAAPGALIIPLSTLTGARLASVADGVGAPALRSVPAPFTRFISPTAVAALGDDIYIADAGAGRVYRYARTLNAMVTVPGVTAGPGTLLAVGSDFSLFVLDPVARRVRQFARNGVPLASFADRASLGRPAGMAIDEARGRLLIADGSFNQIVAFHALGRASYSISLQGDERNRVMGIAGLALGASVMYISDPLCRCVVRAAPDGKVLDTFGHQEIGQPGAIAVDRYERVFVIDTFASAIKVFAEGRLIRELAAPTLGVTRAENLWISEGFLYVVDSVGAQVVTLRLVPMRRPG